MKNSEKSNQRSEWNYARGFTDSKENFETT